MCQWSEEGQRERKRLVPDRDPKEFPLICSAVDALSPQVYMNVCLASEKSDALSVHYYCANTYKPIADDEAALL